MSKDNNQVLSSWPSASEFQLGVRDGSALKSNILSKDWGSSHNHL